jgi:gliding motility-associated-like protein
MPPDTILETGTSVSLPVLVLPFSTGYTYAWTPEAGLSCTDCPEPQAAPVVSTIYELQVLDAYGCEEVGAVRVEVINPRRVYVPNAFSPNGDGRNDYLTVYGGPEVAMIGTFRIYDRWGGEVFVGRDLAPGGQTGWDGRVAGESAPAGVYTWYAVVRYQDGQEEVRKGDVWLMR